jgi:hypothetical protein
MSWIRDKKQGKKNNRQEMKKTNTMPVARLYDGMKAWLMETGLRLQRTDLTDPTHSPRMLNELLSLLHAERGVSEAEEQSVFPELMNSAPYLVCHFEMEHRQAAVLRSALMELVLEFPKSGLPDQMEEKGIQLRLAFASYMAFVLQHWIREEVVVGGLWSHVVGEESSLRIGRELLLSLGREHRLDLLGKMSDGLSGENRRHLFSEIRKMGTEFGELLMASMRLKTKEEGSPVRRVQLTAAA